MGNLFSANGANGGRPVAERGSPPVDARTGSDADGGSPMHDADAELGSRAVLLAEAFRRGR